MQGHSCLCARSRNLNTSPTFFIELFEDARNTKPTVKWAGLSRPAFLEIRWRQTAANWETILHKCIFLCIYTCIQELFYGYLLLLYCSVSTDVCLCVCGLGLKLLPK